MDHLIRSDGGFATPVTEATLHSYGRLPEHIAMEDVAKPPYGCKEESEWTIAASMI